jgi:wbbM protein
MSKEPSVKILVGYHKPAVLLKSDVLVPIHLGRALATEASKDGQMSKEDYLWMLDNMIGDDTGDNISDKNREFCELTGIYWAWKNYDKLGNPDYIGFMHYRRHLSFNFLKTFAEDTTGVVNYDSIDENYLTINKLNDIDIQSVVEKYDIISGAKCNLEKLGTNCPYNHYKTVSPFLHIEDYDQALDILAKKYPEYITDIQEYNKQKYAYFTNCFIMKRDIFKKYCNFCFSILNELQKKLNTSFYNIQEKRAVAYISEWLNGIFITHAYKTDNKILELQRTLIKNTNISPMIYPAFKEHNIPICFSVDKNYILYLGVAIQSLIVNISSEKNYDILIFTSNISSLERKKITQLALSSHNVSIRFFDIKEYIKNKFPASFFTSGHFTEAVYYRAFLPYILEKYSKVIYLDCDLVVNKDIGNLYHINISPNPLGAVVDIEVIRSYKCGFMQKYVDNTLKLKNITKYFNSGVLIMDLRQLRKMNFLDKFLSTIQKISEPWFVDQDIFNVVLENQITLLPTKWNVEYHLPIWDKSYTDHLPEKYLELYSNMQDDPYIVHFAGCKKAWQEPQHELANYFWKYARQTPFYEEILFRNLKKTANETNQNPAKNFPTLADYLAVRFYYIKNKIIYKLSWGKKRQKYKQKYKKYQQQKKFLKKFLKTRKVL